MYYNFLWLFLGSGLSLIGSLSLSYKMSIEEFGVVTALLALASFFSVVCSKGQQGVILTASPDIFQNTLTHSIKRIIPIFSAISILLLYLFIQDSYLHYLLYLISFILLSVICQVMMGLSQARNEIKIIGFYQTLPAIGRSLPALVLFGMAFIWGQDVNSEMYFTYVGVGCFSLVVIMIFVVSNKYHSLNKSQKIVKKNKKENHFWATSILSSSYASIIAPLLLFTWGEAAAGIFGIYLLLWGVTNIALSSIFNNYLVPQYAAIRFDNNKSIEFFDGTLKYSIITSIVIIFSCNIMIEVCLRYIWPVEYSEYILFYYFCIFSLAIRPFSARLGIPFNFSNKIKNKTKIQIISMTFLVISIVGLSFFENYILLASALIFSELIVLFMYKYDRSI